MFSLKSDVQQLASISKPKTTRDTQNRLSESPQEETIGLWGLVLRKTYCETSCSPPTSILRTDHRMADPERRGTYVSSEKRERRSI